MLPLEPVQDRLVPRGSWKALEQRKGGWMPGGKEKVPTIMTGKVHCMSLVSPKPKTWTSDRELKCQLLGSVVEGRDHLGSAPQTW